MVLKYETKLQKKELFGKIHFFPYFRLYECASEKRNKVSFLNKLRKSFFIGLNNTVAGNDVSIELNQSILPVISEELLRRSIW